MKFTKNGKVYRLKPKAMWTIIVILAIICASVFYVCASKNDPHSDQKKDDVTHGTIIDVEGQTEVGTILPETKDAGQTYLDETLFLGDSNTARFLKVAANNGKTFTTKENTIGVVGMGVDGISSLPCMQFNTGLFTMPNATKILQPRRVILTFGTNNLTGNPANAEGFGKRYEKQIKAVQDAYPDADIIINTIPPVDKRCVYPNVKMKEIDACNEEILKLCKENDWKYLNSMEALLDAKSGYAKKDYTINDGLHLSAKGITALFEYVKTHAYITEDRREKPLKPIPQVIGVPHNLINFNPLNDEKFDEDPSEIETEDDETEQTIEVDPNLSNYVGKKEDQLLLAIHTLGYSVTNVERRETEEEILDHIVSVIDANEEDKTVSYRVYICTKIQEEGNDSSDKTSVEEEPSLPKEEDLSKNDDESLQLP